MRAVVRFHLAPWTSVARSCAVGRLAAVKAFRRGLLVASLAVLISGVLRFFWSSKDAPPPTSGGWRELEGPDFR